MTMRRPSWFALGLSIWSDTTRRHNSSVAVAAFSAARLSLPLPPTSTAQSAGPDRRRRRHARLFPLCTSTEDGDGDIPEQTDPSTATELQMQKRFEEAMGRRSQRRKQKERMSSFEVDSMKESTMPDGGVEKVMPSSSEEGSIPTNAAEDEGFRSDPALDMSGTSEAAGGVENESQRSGEKPEMTNHERFMHENDRSPSSETAGKTGEHEPKRKRRGADEGSRFRDHFDDDDDDDGYSDRDFDGDDDGYRDRYSATADDRNRERRYYDYDEGYFSESSPTLSHEYEWETYGSTSILFPPPQSDGAPRHPRAIIHFVGGTFFGSYPRKFYGSLLEDIAEKCHAVIVATPIPLVLPGRGLLSKLEGWMSDEGGGRHASRTPSNPLDHVSLAETIQREFNNAYRDVILDEYCPGYGTDGGEMEGFMKSVPIVGMGHSLGARIQAVSCSHPRISGRYLSMGRGGRLIRSGREGMIYLGFANWGASASIPGVETLDRTARRRERERREEGRKAGVGRREDVWEDRSPRRRGRRGRRDRRDAEELDLSDVFSDVVRGAQRIGEALTPSSRDLEFVPAPDELWGSLASADGRYVRGCRGELIVQFDADPVDQGSRLARTLLAAADAGQDDDKNTASPARDVRFARLAGGHLAPVTLRDGISRLMPRGAVSLLSSSYNFVLDQLDDERAGKSSQKQQREVEDIAATVASYVISLSDDG